MTEFASIETILHILIIFINLSHSWCLAILIEFMPFSLLFSIRYNYLYFHFLLDSIYIIFIIFLLKTCCSKKSHPRFFSRGKYRSTGWNGGWRVHAFPALGQTTLPFRVVALLQYLCLLPCLCQHLVMSCFPRLPSVHAWSLTVGLQGSDWQRAWLFCHVFSGFPDFFSCELLSLSSAGLFYLVVDWPGLSLVFSQNPCTAGIWAVLQAPGLCLLSLQAQCLINVSGDAVVFVRESDLEAMSTQQPAVNCQTSCPGEVTTWRQKELNWVKFVCLHCCQRLTDESLSLGR